MKLKSLASPLVVAITIVGIGCTIAFAGSSPNVILCADKKTGALRYSSTCKSTETLIALNIKGESGPQGQPGIKGDTGPQGSSGLQQVSIKVLDYTGTPTDDSNHFHDGDACVDGTIRDADSVNRPDGYCMVDVPNGYKGYVTSVLTEGTATILQVNKPCSSATLTDWDAAKLTSIITLAENREYSTSRTNGVPLNKTPNGGCVALWTMRAASGITVAIVPN